MAARQKAIADAVKAHKDANGMVKVYPTEPAGDAMVPNYPAIPLTVTSAEAVELISFQPPAFTVYESGNPMPEQKALADAAKEAAWGTTNPSAVPDEPEQTPTPDEQAAKENE